jgi:hypothetical protein
LLICLLGGVLSTFVIVKTTDVKEEHWAADRTAAAEKIAGLTTQGEQLRRDTADANVRALEAQATLAKLQAPRVLDAQKRQDITTAAKPFVGIVYDMAVFPDDSEALAYLEQIETALNDAGWLEVDWPYNDQLGPIRTGKSKIGIAVGVGVTFNARLRGDEQPNEDRASGGVSAVAKVLDPNGLEAVATFGAPQEDKINVHILVGRKPPR